MKSRSLIYRHIKPPDSQEGKTESANTSTGPAQGQTFTTGTNAGGYTINSVTVRMAGYTVNTANNNTTYDLNETTSTFRVRVCRVSGTTLIPYTVKYAISGGTGNPGQGASVNGAGTYLTFTFKAPIVLKPSTVYGFNLGTTADYFEMLGIHDGAIGGNPDAGGTLTLPGPAGWAITRSPPRPGTVSSRST